MGFFNIFGKKYFLGVDFGASSMKAVEITIKNRKPQLVNYGWVDFDFIKEANLNENSSYEDKMKLYIGYLFKKMKPKSKSAYVSMPGFNGLINLIEFPYMEKDEIKNAVEFEARKYIPMSLDDVFLSWDVVRNDGESKEKSGRSQKIQVLLVAAPKKNVQRYEELMRSSGLKINAIELETFSLGRSLVGNDKGVFVVVDIGAKITNITLIEEGVVRISRNIDAGGGEITSTIAKSMNISPKRAEELKKQKRDILNSRESSIILPTLEIVISETLRIIKTYKQKNENREVKISNIIISGGTAKLAGISEYFYQATGISATVGDPWKKLVIEENITPKIKEMGPSFSVAVGLALRGLDELRKK